LDAARKNVDPVIKWANWIAAFTGARLEEIVGAAAADIEHIDGVWCLHIRLDNRGEDATLKTRASTRIVPLHPAILAEGFLGYVNSVPRNGPLFPTLPCDAFGKRSGVATKRLGKWLRAVGITDPRKVYHSWRHTFITGCRNAGIDEETRNRITGHSDKKSVGRGYGSFEIKMMATALGQFKNPY
jgi:integrase